MDLHSGYPFWLVKNGILADYPSLEEDLPDEEILIIGSGISGALCAYALCKAGFKCTMIDKRLLSSGSTWASTAQLNYEIDNSLYELANQYGEKFAVDVYKASLYSVHRLIEIGHEIGIHDIGENASSLYLASDKYGAKSILKEYDIRTKHNIPVSLLNQEDLLQDYGIHKKFALHHHHAVTFDAYKITVGLIEHCRNNYNMNVFTRTGVQNLKPVKNGVKMKTDRGNFIKAKYVVCAPGYESSTFLTQKKIKIVSTYALATQPINPDLFWKDRCLIWESMRPYFYLRTTSDNRILMGGEDEPFSNEKKRDKLLEVKRDQLLLNFKKLFPHIPAEADFYWCGSFGETKDGLPFIGHYPGLENVFFALGYGGNGTSYSILAAEILVNQLTGRPDPRADLFNFKR